MAPDTPPTDEPPGSATVPAPISGASDARPLQPSPEANGRHGKGDKRRDRGKAREAPGHGRKHAARTAVPAGDDMAWLAPLPPDLFINRELSWLAFNRRVLEEAAEQGTPLLERVKFAAIFSANLDDWFMIRVAGVKRKLLAGINEPGPDGRTPSTLITLIQRDVQAALDAQAKLARKELLPALAEQGIQIVPYADVTTDERAVLAEVFERDLFPVLTPQAIDRGRRFPHVSNLSLNLIVLLRVAAGTRYARVKIPAVLPRLVPIPAVDGGDDKKRAARPPLLRFAWLEEVVAAHLPRLFPGADVLAAYPFHVTRDGDILLDEDEEDDDQSDLLVTVRESLSQRTFGAVVRLVVDRSMPDDVRAWLVEQVRASNRDLYVVNGPLALEGLFEIARIERPDLKYSPFKPATLGTTFGENVEDGKASAQPDIFALLRERDVLVHHPFQTFGAVVDFVRAASSDPDVVAIKQTLYRIGKDSPLIPALIEARDDDTQIAVLVELKARFDEENNITWAEELEEHGVHVAYGLTGLKTHCKVTLVVRREGDGLRRYAHLSTGNYNATTARLYEDIGLLTARTDLASDVSELFNALTGFAQEQHYRKLWVAPADLRQRFLAAIKREIDVHKRDGGGHLVFKFNSLVDRESIRALYAASQVGVKIDLIVRGACCLRPGVPGVSDTIRVVSIVGRFLEHSRVYSFRNGGGDNQETYLGSADLMERNLDRRVEAVFPVEDPSLAAHLREVVLPAYLRDTVNARELRADGTYVKVEPKSGAEPFDVQAWLLNHYQRAAADARAAAELAQATPAELPLPNVWSDQPTATVR